jgi:hypothetical protein
LIHSYAGIGSRDISDVESRLLTRIANYMSESGYVLYSGNADGSDIAFQRGCNGLGVAFLPWIGFNKELESKVLYSIKSTQDAYDSVKKYHPAPEKLGTGGTALMARNYHQIHGIGELPLVDVVIYCASEGNGVVSGGTAQAVRIARDLGIPTINVRSKSFEGKIRELPIYDRPDMNELLEIFSK